MFYVVSTNLTLPVCRLFTTKRPNAINKTDAMISGIDHAKLQIYVGHPHGTQMTRIKRMTTDYLFLV